MRKRILAIALVLFLLFPGAVRSVAVAASGPFFTAHSNVPAAQGGVVTVPVSVSGNPGFASVALYVAFDSNVFEFSTASSTASDMQVWQITPSATPGAQSVSLANPTRSDWDGTGVLLNLIFNVRPNSPTGLSFIELSFAASPENAAGGVLPNSVVTSGSVNIVSSSAATEQVTAVTGNQDNDDWDDWGDWDDDWGDDWDEWDDWVLWSDDSTDDDQADSGAFIGTPYIPGETASVSQSNPQSVTPLHFGTVPQTNTPNLTILIVAIVVNFFIIAGLLIAIAYYKRKQSEND